MKALLPGHVVHKCDWSAADGDSQCHRHGRECGAQEVAERGGAQQFGKMALLLSIESRGRELGGE